MKRRLFSFTLLMCVTSALAADLRPGTPAPCMDKRWFRKHQYLSSLVLQASRKPPLDIYFLGDSLTEYWPQLGTDVWNAEFGKLHVLNCGIAGDTTQNVLYRITNGEFDHIHPKVVVLLAGINNLGLNATLQPDDLSAGLQKIVATLRSKSPESKILLLSIFPSGEPADPIRKRIIETNKLLAKLDDNHSVFYLDIYGAFLDSAGNFSPDITPDGTHLNAKGYEIWANAMHPTLNKLLTPEN